MLYPLNNKNMIKDYLKYLLKKPSKLAWILAANAIIIAFAYYFFSDITEIMGDNPIWMIALICILITATVIAVQLQPFIEWRDGKDRK